jgi:hypothetical protein
LSSLHFFANQWPTSLALVRQGARKGTRHSFVRNAPPE